MIRRGPSCSSEPLSSLPGPAAGRCRWTLTVRPLRPKWAGEAIRLTLATRGRRARAASHPGSQHVDLAAWRGRVEPVPGQPADRQQASQRPPGADHVEVDVRAIAGDDVTEVFLMSERQAGEVVQGFGRSTSPSRPSGSRKKMLSAPPKSLTVPSLAPLSTSRS